MPSCLVPDIPVLDLSQQACFMHRMITVHRLALLLMVAAGFMESRVQMMDST